jgi:hypothetical protein
MKIVWTLLCRGRTDEFIYSVRNHAPFVDHSIIVLHGDVEENKENEEYLVSAEAKQWDLEVVRSNIPYDPKALRDLYMERLDVYLEKVGEPVWFLLTDSDEYLELPALYTLRLVAEEAEKQGFNIVGFNSHDIQPHPDGKVWEQVSSYWNPNFNKHYLGMRYTPGTHIGLARPVAPRMAKSPHRYFHVKTVGSQWIRGCRNYWTTAAVAQNTTDDPAWQEFKTLCAKHGIENFDGMVKLMHGGEVPEELTRWFILNRNSDNSEARSWFVVYYVFLHPELNFGCAGNRDYDYDKDRKPCVDLTF